MGTYLRNSPDLEFIRAQFFMPLFIFNILTFLYILIFVKNYIMLDIIFIGIFKYFKLIYLSDDGIKYYILITYY